MKTNKNIAKLAVIFVCLLCLTFSANAQKRRTTSKKTKTPPRIALTSNSEIKDGAQKVSVQIKNVSKFIYVLGGIAKSIEDIDKEAKTGRVSPEITGKNTKFKQSVIQSIRNLRAGLVALEIEFRTKPALRNYLFQIQGISDMTGVAEDQATGGQLTDSGKTLLQVIEKLSDTLAALP
ncbi:MAG: hypothetical protein ACR2MG_17560 [Pyrinomonadaceae bacterium]